MERLDYNTDRYPFTGKRKVNIPAIVANKEWLKKYYDGSENVEQVKGITIGNQYLITEVEGFGDVFDVTFINDNGEEQTLASCFFEDVSKDNILVKCSECKYLKENHPTDDEVRLEGADIYDCLADNKEFNDWYVLSEGKGIECEDFKEKS